MMEVQSTVQKCVKLIEIVKLEQRALTLEISMCVRGLKMKPREVPPRARLKRSMATLAWPQLSALTISVYQMGRVNFVHDTVASLATVPIMICA